MIGVWIGGVSRGVELAAADEANWPYPQRRAALGLEALDDFAGPDSGRTALLA